MSAAFAEAWISRECASSLMNDQVCVSILYGARDYSTRPLQLTVTRLWVQNGGAKAEIESAQTPGPDEPPMLHHQIVFAPRDEVSCSP